MNVAGGLGEGFPSLPVAFIKRIGAYEDAGESGWAAEKSRKEYVMKRRMKRGGSDP